MLQYKLYELLDNEQVINELYDIFGHDNIYVFTDRIVGIAYDYSSNGYSYVLKKVINLNLRQFIITSNRFFRMIDYCVSSDCFIREISFVDAISEDTTEFVRTYIDKINASQEDRDKNIYKNQLFSELDWVTSDECIDVKLITTRIKAISPPIFVDVELYHNGILFVSNLGVLDKIKEVFSLMV